MVFWVSALALVAFMVAVWALSVALRDASIVDIAWGLCFVVVAWIAIAAGDGDPDRSLLLALLVSAWGLRLGGYILWRKLREPGEDRRYTAMRERSNSFARDSLYRVFLVQAALAWIVSLPLQGAAGEAGGLGTARLDRCCRLGARARVRDDRRCPVGGLQGRPGEQGRDHGPRPLALHPPPQLLR